MPTARTAALAALGTVGVIFGSILGVYPSAVFAVLLVLLALLVLLDRSLAADPRRLTLARSGATTVRLGESTQVTLSVRNPTQRPGELLIRDAWVPSAGASDEPYQLRLPAGATALLPTALTPTRRGDRPAARVTVRSRGPFGLAFRQADHDVPWTLRVLPRFASRKHLPEKLSRLRTVEGATAIRGRGQGSEFDVLREYVPGDDVRSIDWRATARRGDVMLRTWRPERSRRVVCVLDTGRTSAVRVGDEPRLDAAMEAALLLAAVAREAGDQVDLIAADHRVRAVVTATQSRSLLPRLVDAVAPLQPAMVETDFELITSEVLRRERKRSLVVVFTALEPGALGEGLLPVLPKLAARHRVLIAAVHDHALTELAATPLDAPGDVYAAAAGTRALADRERIASALSRNGVTVLDFPADVFASRVTDAYLDLKASGKL
ncbi:DUF58 domain-containing protein [Catellatospora tritici]|uniref:DUF58 domain-containing protein n=1 Tax=Catellatospora tritici TaxID=2851566 RepID=UPI001C2DB23D|nr:DUF58 domain-containing protein [Catellatospora tritici]MBV1849481.1 DUF58 domain-containing protein [Catellatospora tritici]MBV1854053.1 DUF58 domain-containing protein [Catellatospora tritici]